MKYISTLVSILFFASFAIAQDKVINDRNAVSRTVGSFTGIQIENGIDLYLTQSKEEAVAVSGAKPESRDKIRTVVENGILKISFGDKNWMTINWGNQNLRAYVSFKTLESLNAGGGSDVLVNGTMNVTSLKLNVSGGSDFKGAVNANDIELKASGGSDVDISGKAVNLKIVANGGSDVDGYNMVSDNCNASASGGSDIQITVNKELSANASGGSDVNYKGSGVIKEVSKSGGSGVRKRS